MRRILLASWAVLATMAVARIAVLWWAAQKLWQSGPVLGAEEAAMMLRWEPILLAGAVGLAVGTLLAMAVALSDRPRSRALVSLALLAAGLAALSLVPLRVLQAASVRLNGAGAYGTAWLEHASTACNRPLVEALIAAGTTVKQPGAGGVTPLHLVARQCEVTVIRMVLDAGAPLEAATDQGATPLMYAVEMNGADAVALLLSRGANTDIQRADGTRLIDLARQRGNTRMLALVSGRDADYGVRGKQ
jgi:hypothetical protein